VDEDRPTRFWLSNLSAGTPMRELALAAISGWWARRGQRRLIDELGIGQFEGRSWLGLHHHLSLGLVAAGFLVHRAARRGYRLGE
jgi:SRSO17 transposase